MPSEFFSSPIWSTVWPIVSISECLFIPSNDTQHWQRKPKNRNCLGSRLLNSIVILPPAFISLNDFESARFLAKKWSWTSGIFEEFIIFALSFMNLFTLTIKFNSCCLSGVWPFIFIPFCLSNVSLLSFANFSNNGLIVGSWDILIKSSVALIFIGSSGASFGVKSNSIFPSKFKNWLKSIPLDSRICLDSILRFPCSVFESNKNSSYPPLMVVRIRPANIFWFSLLKPSNTLKT